MQVRAKNTTFNREFSSNSAARRNVTSNLDFVKARMGNRVRMTRIGDSQTNE